jgi:hypothetical protein
MNDSKPKPYGDLKAKVRTYTDKEGKEKGVYVKVGTLFASEHFSHMYITLEAIPISKDWNGIVSVFKREDAEQKLDEVVTDTDEPINLNDVPF